MQSKNKESVEIKSKAGQICEAAQTKLNEHVQNVKAQLDSQHHGELDSEIISILKRHEEEGESLKGPTGLAAEAKQNTKHLSKMGNQKNILRFLTLHTAHNKLDARLKGAAIDQSIAMAANRVHDLMGR